MQWTRVVKTIRGRHYCYWQRTERVPGRRSPRTYNKYIGPIGRDAASPLFSWYYLRMITMTLETDNRRGDLDQQTNREDFAHHLAAARFLAGKGISVETIHGLMHGRFTRAEIEALFAATPQPLPVIS